MNRPGAMESAELAGSAAAETHLLWALQVIRGARPDLYEHADEHGRMDRREEEEKRRDE